MKAVARYFADTDLYLGGPGSDWPSKDHAFFGGERVCKQAILLNDLTRDLPVTLRWQLADRAGRNWPLARSKPWRGPACPRCTHRVHRAAGERAERGSSENSAR